MSLHKASFSWYWELQGYPRGVFFLFVWCLLKNVEGQENLLEHFFNQFPKLVETHKIYFKGKEKKEGKKRKEVKQTADTRPTFLHI